jgi:hypothetical protein
LNIIFKYIYKIFKNILYFIKQLYSISLLLYIYILNEYKMNVLVFNIDK